MKKVGIATVYTGYNYGSALQAFATKVTLNQLGYEGELLKICGSLVPGRDIRLEKLFVIAFRTLLKPSEFMRSFQVYRKSISKELSFGSVQMFQDFIARYLQPRSMGYRKMKQLSHADEYSALVCGSDQIWNSTTYYVDPFYYLRFAPEKKRIAYVPSFGRDFIPKYNLSTIRRYIEAIPSLSVRETSGSKLIRQMVGIHVPVLQDPTMVLSCEQWSNLLGLENTAPDEPYILAYFLDAPGNDTLAAVHRLAQETGFRLLGIPYSFGTESVTENIIPAGPKEFLSLVKNARLVCTDSFHGTAFSLVFQVPFFTFERRYGKTENQSDRIRTLLEMTGTASRFCINSLPEGYGMDFSGVSAVLENERAKSLRYLEQALGDIEEKT